MSATRPGAILRHLHPADPDDAALLARYAGRRDPAAFAALVRRHGPTVLAVCRRVTGHAQDAEDAFQAAFLVLARSAGSVRKPERLGSWLYGVAVKVAGRARRTAARRRRREVTVAAFPDVPAPDPAPPDIGPALHEELAALPALHREPIILCDLQGLSRAEAARALGIPEGTLSSRLANGRKRLAGRLTRRGVALSLAALPAAVADGRAAVPDELVSNTCGLAAAWAAGAPLPAAVVRLARGGFPMRGVLLGGVLTLSLAAGAAWATGLADPPRPPDPPVAVARDAGEQPPKKAEAPKKAEPVTFLPPRLRDSVDVKLKLVRAVAWSPDGRWVAAQGHAGLADANAAGRAAGPAGADGASELVVFPAENPGRASAYHDLPPHTGLVGFPPADAGGQPLLTVTRETGLISGKCSLREWRVVEEVPLGARGGGLPGLDGRKESVPIPTDAVGFVARPGALRLRFLAGDFGRLPVYRFWAAEGMVVRLAGPDGKVSGTGELAEDRRVGPVTGVFHSARLTPDGEKVLAVTVDGVVECYAAADGKRLWTGPAEPPVPPGVGVTNTAGVVWPVPSRDGRRVLVVRNFRLPEVLDGTTGKALPPLEQAEAVLAGTERVTAALSADGRLAALGHAVAPKLAPNQPPPAGPPAYRLAVWETETGKLVREWRGEATGLAFHPTRPRLAVFEANGDRTRLGLWEFPAGD